jgi:peptidoglycan-associated lipoprotein
LCAVLLGCAPSPEASAPERPVYFGPLALAPSIAPQEPPPALRPPGTAADFALNIPADVQFLFDSAVLNEEAMARLDRQAQWLRLYPEYSVTITGHADERGSPFYNLELGLARARAVQDYLVARGVHTSRIAVVSYGASRPADAGQTEAAWARNRRAETVLTQ